MKKNVLILFEHLKQIINIAKVCNALFNSKIQMGLVGSTFEPHPGKFEKYVFSIDLQMILLVFFDIPNQKSII